MKEVNAAPHPSDITLKKIIWEMVSDSNGVALCDIILYCLPRKRSEMRSERLSVPEETFGPSVNRLAATEGRLSGNLQYSVLFSVQSSYR